MDELEEIMNAIRYHIGIATSGLVKISDDAKLASLLKYRASIARGFLADAVRTLDVIERNMAEPPSGEIRPE